MTATDELRHMLDERGVEWRDSSDENVLHTTWNDMNCWFNEFPDGWTAWGMAMRGTPEQAVAATLGETPTPPPPTPPKQPPYDLLIDLMRDEWGIDVSWDGLRRFWYVGLNEKGMRMRDERDATLGRGTCKVEYVSDWMGWHCKACDVLWQGLRDQRPRFCLNCGAEVVDA